MEKRMIYVALGIIENLLGHIDIKDMSMGQLSFINHAMLDMKEYLKQANIMECSNYLDGKKK